MRWGIRKEYQTSGIIGLENYTKSTASSVNNVSKNMEKAYGFRIKECVPLSDRQVKKGFVAYVEGSTKIKDSNVIHLNTDPNLNKTLVDAQKNGWFVKTNPKQAVESMLTHESAHGMLHVNTNKGFFKDIDPARMDSMRKNAWKKAEVQARKDGDVVSKRFRPDAPEFQMAKKLSRYAEASVFLEESEAELFAAYHWSSNPPKFVDVFMNEIHSNMGKKVQPFSGRKTHGP